MKKKKIGVNEPFPYCSGKRYKKWHKVTEDGDFNAFTKKSDFLQSTKVKNNFLDNVTNLQPLTLQSILQYIESKDTILKELESPFVLNNFQRRIDLCRLALTRTNYDKERSLWGRLQYELAFSLSKCPTGNLADNLEEAISRFFQSTKVIKKKKHWLNWVNIQNNLGQAYANRIRGDTSENIELAIKYSKSALKVCKYKKSPEVWANTHINLGIAYSKRIQGEKDENTKISIKHYQLALTVFNKQIYPKYWAKVQNGLGIIYAEKIRNKRAENLEVAIKHFQNVSTLCTYIDRENKEIVAGAHHNLGNAYLSRIRGDKSENIKQAITYYETALEVRTYKALPFDWAETMLSLANAYQLSKEGDKEQNIDLATECCKAISKIYTLESFPKQWARIQHTLANGYLERSEVQQKENQTNTIEESIRCCLEALKFYDKETYLAEYAHIHLLLGTAYYKRKKENKVSNFEKSIEYLNQAADVYTKEDFPSEWGQVQHNLGSIYTDRTGNRADNIETAITHFQDALKVRTLESTPEEWASTQTNLGNAYLYRVKEDGFNNIERAIEHYHLSLQIFTEKHLPSEWANVQNSLGHAYFELETGYIPSNIDDAIKFYEKALQVFTIDNFPEKWAMIQNNLGAAYAKRILGEKLSNLEQSIKHYISALKVYTNDTFPEKWAMVQNNLGVTYAQRIQGEQAHNLEQAIKTYELSLSTNTRELSPNEWALAHRNLGEAYLSRVCGDAADNLEKAIEHLKLALNVHTRDSSPDQWASTQNSLGIAYARQDNGDKERNIEEAIKHLGFALEEREKERCSYSWGNTQINLGSAYIQRIKGVKAKNIERAIDHYKQALLAFNERNHPHYWAMVQDNLGLAYSRSRNLLGNQDENIEQAINHYGNALKVYTLESFPLSYQQTTGKLGDIHFYEQNWQEAYTAYNKAIDASDFLLAEAYTEVGRQSQVERTTKIYSRAAYCLLKMGKPLEAFLHLEQGKTRLLSEALIIEHIDLSQLSEKQKQDLLGTRKKIYDLEADMRLQSDKPTQQNSVELGRLLQDARTELKQIMKQVHTRKSSVAPDLSLSDIKPLIPQHGAIVSLSVTRYESAVFILPYEVETITEQHIILIKSFNDSVLESLLIGNNRSFGWLNEHLSHDGKVTDDWLRFIELFTKQLWETLIQPIFCKLMEFGLREGDTIILMPQGKLGLLPLHAAWREVNGVKRSFIDDFLISYSLSTYMLKTSLQRVEKRKFLTSRLLTIVNPTNSVELPYASYETDAVNDIWFSEEKQILSGSGVTEESILRESSRSTYLHFACHGFYNWKEIMRSGLQLPGGANLTLSTIVSRLDLSITRLVVLSACQTALTEFQKSPDEYIGLPAGFLQAGVPGVIGTLWSVADLSTALLMIRFYELLINSESPIKALCNAQQWLKNITSGELLAYFENQIEINRSQHESENKTFLKKVLAKGVICFELAEPESRPFENPYFWAPFIFIGL